MQKENPWGVEREREKKEERWKTREGTGGIQFLHGPIPSLVLFWPYWALEERTDKKGEGEEKGRKG